LRKGARGKTTHHHVRQKVEAKREWENVGMEGRTRGEKEWKMRERLRLGDGDGD
jgi:hypothetical protein